MDMRRSMIIKYVKMSYFVVETILLLLHLFLYEGIMAEVSPFFLIVICAGYNALLLLIGKQYSAYSVGQIRVSELACSIALTNAINSLSFYVIACIGARQLLPVFNIFLSLVAQCLWGLVWSFIANSIYFRLCKPQKAVAIYKKRDALQRVTAMHCFSLKYDLMSMVENPKTLAQVISVIDDCDVVFAVGINAELQAEITSYCMLKNIVIWVDPSIQDIMMFGSIGVGMTSESLVSIVQQRETPEYVFLKRVGDILLSATGLVLTFPLFLLASLAIKLCDNGPVFYKQIRLTKGRKKFQIIKFRSMKTDAEKDGIARMASDNDTRITPVGRILRTFRLDELPQLINILKGEMSIVGPRPERLELVEEYEQAIPAFALRLQVKAGLTGYAQVYGKYNTVPEDKLKLDLFYINSMSILEDLKILLATIKVIFNRESTSGICSDQTSALHRENSVGKEAR